jgi:hypothetical protein
MGNAGESVGDVRITANDTTAVPENADDAAVLPVGDSVFER